MAEQDTQRFESDQPTRRLDAGEMHEASPLDRYREIKTYLRQVVDGEISFHTGFLPDSHTVDVTGSVLEGYGLLPEVWSQPQYEENTSRRTRELVEYSVLALRALDYFYNNTIFGPNTQSGLRVNAVSQVAGNILTQALMKRTE